MWPFLSLTAIRPLEGEKLSRINQCSVTDDISLEKTLFVAGLLITEMIETHPIPRQAVQSS
jgi:hypothetical protein